ncbi:uncharacterized protein LOC111695731 isoform X2 [Eurytemora carolleeae]|uniref:uncharacterized protein LOC111695731 isoform X2 n=1 Tax=Eurytemora carolleeae TaxID=1294199 RepID=UPI000C79390A|nr:uncharacterized protein LOC111695731 isoform X2 [Eurytemora carolleeae]|eukprot:XP_023320924.1 uncharacterized protein LOC111695731 isoform X2 [Eurytemora affinis]
MGSFTFLLSILLIGQVLSQSRDEYIRAHRLNRERARQARKQSIKDHVETLFNWKGKSMPSGTDGLMDGIQVPGDSRSKLDISQYPMDFTERVQSFFPECDIDDNYLLQLPDTPNSEILIFKIKFPVPRPGTLLSIVEARLRMFKLHSEMIEDTPDCPREQRMRITASWIQLKNHANSDAVAETVMLDSIMVDLSVNGWISLDVTGAVRSWYNHPHRPSAVLVEVENSRRETLQTRNLLQPLNCSSSSAGANPTLSSGSRAARPSPYLPGAPLLNLNQDMHPLIDITTFEVPTGKGRTGSNLSPGVSEPEQSSSPLPGASSQYTGDSNKFLQKLQEIDYLASSSLLEQRYPTRDLFTAHHKPRGLGSSDPTPIFQKVVLSRDELLRRLGELNELQTTDRDTEARVLSQLLQQVINDS